MEDLRTWAVTARPGLRRPTPVPSSLGSSSLGFTSSPSPFSSSSPENVEDSGLDSPSLAAPGPSPESWVPRPGTPQSPPTCRAQHQEARDPVPRVPSPGPWGPEAGAGADSLTLADPTREGLAATLRRPRSRKVSCPLTRSSGDLCRSLSPSPLGSSAPTIPPDRPSFSAQMGHGLWGPLEPRTPSLTGMVAKRVRRALLLTI